MAKTTNRQREASDLGKMLYRILGALVRRAATGETDALVALVNLEKLIGLSIAGAINGLHEAGLSYDYIAAEIGVSRQAVIKRARRGLDT